MSDYQMFEVQVSQVEPLTEQVKRFTLVATDGKPLPAFTGGSHIIVQMSDGDNQYSNAYSLLSSPHRHLLLSDCRSAGRKLARRFTLFASAGKSGRSVNDFDA